MHRVLQTDGTFRQSQFLHWASTFSYVLFAVAGLLFAVSPRISDVYGDSGVWMAGFVFVGGIMCAIGAGTRHWAGEFMGAPLLAVGLSILGLETYNLNHNVNGYYWIATANLSLLVALSIFIILRWRIILGVYRFAHAVAKAEKSRDLVGDEDE